MPEWLNRLIGQPSSAKPMSTPPAVAPDAGPIPITDPTDAKEKLLQIRLDKRELLALKREVNAELADARAMWRQRQAGRLPTMSLGRGKYARYARGAIQMNRRDERMNHDLRLRALEARKAEIDATITDIDRLVIQLERVARG